MKIICVHPEKSKQPKHLFAPPHYSRIFFTTDLSEALHALNSREYDILLLHYDAASEDNIIPFIERNSRHIPILVLHTPDTCLSTEKLINAGAQDIISCQTKQHSADLYEAIVKAMYRHHREQHIHRALEQAQKMEAIGRMAGGIAHDYNNLLTVILNDAVLIRDGLSPETPMFEDVTEQISVIKQAAGLTKRLLMMARGRPFIPQTTDLNQIVQSMQHILRHVSGDRISLNINCHPTPLCIAADAAQIEQALLNLMINACDAIWYKGHVTISTGLATLAEESDPFYLTASEENDVEYACLTVTDSGDGVSEENCPRIFEPFFSTKGSQQGSGLGLYQVYSILAQHKGAISLASTPGRGTRIKLFFATSTAHPAPAQLVEQENDFGEKDTTILLVEDDEQVRRTTQRLLVRIGYKVIEASCCKAALEITHPLEKVDILISDVMMPDGTGTQLADQLQRKHPSLKVLLSSGYPEAKLRQQNLLPDKYRFLSKPLFRDKLIRTLAELLQND